MRSPMLAAIGAPVDNMSRSRVRNGLVINPGRSGASKLGESRVKGEQFRRLHPGDHHGRRPQGTVGPSRSSNP